MGSAPAAAVLRVTRARVYQVLSWAGAIAAILCLGTWLTVSSTIPRGAWGGWGGVLQRAVSLGAEDNLGAGYSALLLLAVSLTWLGCFVSDREAGADGWARFGWLLLAGLFAALSLDEAGSFHERLGAVHGLNQLEVIAVPLAAVGLFMLAFAWVRLRRSVAGLLWLAFAFLCYVSVPLQEELVERIHGTAQYAVSWHSAATDVLLEEGTELLGTLAFWVGSLIYLRALAGVRNQREIWVEGSLPLDTRRWFRVAGIMVALLTAAFTVVEFAVQVLPHDDGFKPGQLGSPSAWFAATMGVLVGLALLAIPRLAKAGGRGPHMRRLYVGAGVASLGLALHIGSGHLLSDIVWWGSPRRAAATRVALAISTVALAGAAAVRARSRMRAGALLGAGALLALGLLQHEPTAGVLAFAGFALMGLGLIHTADDVLALR